VYLGEGQLVARQQIDPKNSYLARLRNDAEQYRTGAESRQQHGVSGWHKEITA
jgi:hypothetical protein